MVFCSSCCCIGALPFADVVLLSYENNEYVRFNADASADDVRAAAQVQAEKNHTRAFFNLNRDELKMRFLPPKREGRAEGEPDPSLCPLGGPR